MWTIEAFGVNSYYKMNVSKCQVLTTNLNQKIPNKLKSLFPCNWDTDKIQNLGIHPTAKSSSLYYAKYKKLLYSVQAELLQLGKYEISWLGWITTFKMIILSKILYIFRTCQYPYQLIY